MEHKVDTAVLCYSNEILDVILQSSEGGGHVESIQRIYKNVRAFYRALPKSSVDGRNEKQDQAEKAAR